MRNDIIPNMSLNNKTLLCTCFTYFSLNVVYVAYMLS